MAKMRPRDRRYDAAYMKAFKRCAARGDRNRRQCDRVGDQAGKRALTRGGLSGLSAADDGVNLKWIFLSGAVSAAAAAIGATVAAKLLEKTPLVE